MYTGLCINGTRKEAPYGSVHGEGSGLWQHSVSRILTKPNHLRCIRISRGIKGQVDRFVKCQGKRRALRDQSLTDLFLERNTLSLQTAAKKIQPSLYSLATHYLESMPLGQKPPIQPRFKLTKDIVRILGLEPNERKAPTTPTPYTSTHHQESFEGGREARSSSHSRSFSCSFFITSSGSRAFLDGLGRR